MSKAAVTMEDWAVVQDVSSHGLGELSPGNRLMGYALRHPHFTGSILVFTSPILSVDLDQGLVETANTMYRLGEANSEYKSWVNKHRAAAA
jgi:hypothetical protein